MPINTNNSERETQALNNYNKTYDNKTYQSARDALKDMGLSEDEVVEGMNLLTDACLHCSGSTTTPDAMPNLALYFFHYRVPRRVIDVCMKHLTNSLDWEHLINL